MTSLLSSTNRGIARSWLINGAARLTDETTLAWPSVVWSTLPRGRRVTRLAPVGGTLLHYSRAGLAPSV